MPSYRTHGSCSREILFKVDEENKLTELKFIGGCNGNLQGISRLVVGMEVDRVIETLKGIQCRNKTSCPDQLALALMEFKEKQAMQDGIADSKK